MSPDDDNLEDVMQSIRWASFGSHGGVYIDLDNLVEGERYKAQFLFSENCCPQRGFDIYAENRLILEDFGPGETQLAFGGSNGLLTNANNGALVTYEFTANDSNILFSLLGTADLRFTDRNAIINGFTLENITPPVPEPATAVFAVLAAGGLAMRRRRHNART